MIVKGALVKVLSTPEILGTALVISNPYCTVFTPEDRPAVLSESALISSEVIVVDLLYESSIFKKIPVENLEKVRKNEN